MHASCTAQQSALRSLFLVGSAVTLLDDHGGGAKSVIPAVGDVQKPILVLVVVVDL